MVLTDAGSLDGTDLDSEGGVGAECLDGLIKQAKETPDHVSENIATLASIPATTITLVRRCVP